MWLRWRATATAVWRTLPVGACWSANDNRPARLTNTDNCNDSKYIIVYWATNDIGIRRLIETMTRNKIWTTNGYQKRRTIYETPFMFMRYAAQSIDTGLIRRPVIMYSTRRETFHRPTRTAPNGDNKIDLADDRREIYILNGNRIFTPVI